MDNHAAGREAMRARTVTHGVLPAPSLALGAPGVDCTTASTRPRKASRVSDLSGVCDCGSPFPVPMISAPAPTTANVTMFTAVGTGRPWASSICTCTSATPVPPATIPAAPKPYLIDAFSEVAGPVVATLFSATAVSEPFRKAFKGF